MKRLNGLLGGGNENEDGLEERRRQPERWAGDRLAALLLACGSGPPGRATWAAPELRLTLEWIPVHGCGSGAEGRLVPSRQFTSRYIPGVSYLEYDH